MKFAYILTLWLAILVSNSQAQEDSTTIANETVHSMSDTRSSDPPCFSTVTFHRWNENANDYIEIKR